MLGASVLISSLTIAVICWTIKTLSNDDFDDEKPSITTVQSELSRRNSRNKRMDKKSQSLASIPTPSKKVDELADSTFQILIDNVDRKNKQVKLTDSALSLLEASKKSEKLQTERKIHPKLKNTINRNKSFPKIRKTVASKI